MQTGFRSQLSCHLKVLAVLCLFTAAGLASIKAEPLTIPRSEWILLTGGSGRDAWWTVKKLHPLSKDDSGVFRGDATLRILLLAIFSDSPVILAGPMPRSGLDIAVKINPHAPLRTTLEDVSSALFQPHKLHFSVGLPFEQRLKTNSLEFIRNPIVVILDQQSNSLATLWTLTRRALRNRSLTLGDDDLQTKLGESGKDLSQCWQTMLSEVSPEITVDYSPRLGTLFFSVPKSAEKDFHGYFEGIYSDTNHWH